MFGQNLTVKSSYQKLWSRRLCSTKGFLYWKDCQGQWGRNSQPSRVCGGGSAWENEGAAWYIVHCHHFLMFDHLSFSNPLPISTQETVDFVWMLASYRCGQFRRIRPSVSLNRLFFSFWGHGWSGVPVISSITTFKFQNSFQKVYINNKNSEYESALLHSDCKHPGQHARLRYFSFFPTVPGF